MKALAIKDVAERTGLTAATIRVWEQRHGFPAPERASSGYRRYTDGDVHILRRVLAHYRAVQRRYRRLATVADAALVFADFAALAEPPAGPIEVPISLTDAIGNEWAVVVDAPGYAACLLALEDPDTSREPALPAAERRFEAIWTLDPHVVRRAAEVGGTLAGRVSPELGRRVHSLLADRPLAAEAPAPALTALTNRIVSYLGR